MVSSSNGIVVRTVYKLLLAETKKLHRATCKLVPTHTLPTGSLFGRIRKPLTISEWGSGNFVDLQRQSSIIDELVGGLCSPPEFFEQEKIVLPARADNSTNPFEFIDLRELIRNEFKLGSSEKDPEKIQALIDKAFLALREVYSQNLLSACSIISETENIWVEATGSYLEAHSSPLNNRFRYIYRIRIHNAGKDRVRVTGRHYKFCEANGECMTVPKGTPGVVGYTPVIHPGKTFEYSSGVDLESAEGGEVDGELQLVRFLDKAKGSMIKAADSDLSSEEEKPGETEGSVEEEHEEVVNFDAVVGRFSLLPTLKSDK